MQCVCVCVELCVTDETGTGGGVSECARVRAGDRGERVWLVGKLQMGSYNPNELQV